MEWVSRKWIKYTSLESYIIPQSTHTVQLQEINQIIFSFYKTYIIIGLAVKVILDSSFLLTTVKQKIDPFEGLSSLLNQTIDPILLSPVINEIKRISLSGKTNIRQSAKLVLTLAKKCRYVDVGATDGVDETILEMAKKLNAIVATNDKNLIKKLKDAKIARVYIRGIKTLALEGFVK